MRPGRYSAGADAAAAAVADARRLAYGTCGASAVVLAAKGKPSSMTNAASLLAASALSYASHSGACRTGTEPPLRQPPPVSGPPRKPLKGAQRSGGANTPAEPALSRKACAKPTSAATASSCSTSEAALRPTATPRYEHTPMRHRRFFSPTKCVSSGLSSARSVWGREGTHHHAQRRELLRVRDNDRHSRHGIKLAAAAVARPPQPAVPSLVPSPRRVG